MIRRIPQAFDIGMLLMRLSVGVVFTAHGWQKLSEYGYSGTTKAFQGMGVPLPGITAFCSTWVELLGGIALILGVVTQAAGLLLVLDMLGAFVFVHLGNGVFVNTNGFELVLTLGVVSLTLVLVGPGRFSVDGLLSRRKSDPAATASRDVQEAHSA